MCVLRQRRAAFHSMLSGPLSELLGRADITMGQTMRAALFHVERVFILCAAHLDRRRHSRNLPA
jgi:hypothetical protein